MSDINPNARGHRASICVRACNGILDKVLEDPEYSVKAELDSLDKIIETSAQLLQQRDELLTALKDAHGYMVDGQSSYKWLEAYKIIDAAISKIEATK